ncbi:hypothetical protein L7F22_007971 [Adiantum nelumboides]|nr:hypothetical protein [Adiantum nelumboides]
MDEDGLLHNAAAKHGDSPANTKRGVQAHAPDRLFQASFLPKAVPNLLPLDSLLCQEGKPTSAVDRTLDTTNSLDRWVDSRDNLWTSDDETQEDSITYVNLLLNAERFTGYTGASSQRIWNAIYEDNINFASTQESTLEPLENRVLYKLISGLHSQFRNISSLMDCVGCEKCRLWGKLQILGLGTALEILFSHNGGPFLLMNGHHHLDLYLHRNEVVALINLLNKLSESIHLLHHVELSFNLPASSHLLPSSHGFLELSSL